ncbi:MAG: hypothetical protein HN712_17950 [Gemmatimonadetes bacterium]|jgi:hypothetical protein|nr:hypothetical protein [Gemmatimonadota bacterium]MBT6146334.1 hypothetical protein [Gemmatimonadota bacterium]MBT7862206.1 hypothetical protein [Gemmatimonadota bacterium]
MTSRRLLTYLLLWLGFASAFATPAAAVLRSDVLSRPRTVTGSRWLDLHLRLLGLELTYPAYRVHLGLDETGEMIRFDFWISAPLARHLEDAGRNETRRVLSHHAAGIRDQLQEMLEKHFVDLAGDFDSEVDLVGSFFAPGEDIQAPPRQIAGWEKNTFTWPTSH